MRARENVGPGILNAWSAQNTNSTTPAATLKDGNNEGRTSDYFMVSTSYFKLRNIQIGYSITPKSIFSRLHIFAMAENLFWIKSKNFIGPDPERINISPIPIPKTFSIGINTTF
jgi:hypothetical protein